MQRFLAHVVRNRLAFLTCPAVCGSGGQPMQITSSAFPDGGKIPLPYVMPGAGGQNVSVPLSWSGAPAGTQSFALAMVDPHPVARNWVHWLVIDLPKDSTSIPEGASGHKMPPGAAGVEKLLWGDGVRRPATSPGQRRPSLRVHPLCPERAQSRDRQERRTGRLQAGPGGQDPGHRHPHRLFRPLGLPPALPGQWTGLPTSARF